MTLLAEQTRFLSEIAADDDVPPSSIGMGIYRNAYRARLIGALESGYERTRRWVGEEAFEAAAAHYILTQPPSSWTLDAFGAQFPDLLAELFAGDAEVAEMAWLEWHMQQAFAAPDLPELDAAQLAASGLEETDWEHLRLVPAAGLAARSVEHDLAVMWHSLADGSARHCALSAINPAVLLVWRKDMRPQFRLLEPAEFAALKPLLDGATFGEAAVEIGEAELVRFGQWFAQWLNEGLFSAIAA